MEWDFTDITAMSEPKKNEWDFSDISAMGNNQTPPAVPGSPPFIPTPPTIPGVPPVKTLPNQEVIRDFIPAVKYGENTLQLNKAIGALSDRQHTEENPWDALSEMLVTIGSGGLPKRPKTDEELAALEQEVADRTKVQEAKRVMGTKDIDTDNLLSDIPSFLAGNIGASGPAMARSIASLGTMTPDIMTNEINANLKDIEGLSTKERRALSKGGGMIAAMLENIGLGFIIKGVPPSVFAKMGMKKTAEWIEKSVAAKVVSKGGVASVTEGITEGGQEATGIAAELIAGKEFKPGEIAERIIEAAKVGASVGGAISTGTATSVEVPKAATKKVAEKLKPEQTEDAVPKFDKTVDRRKKLELQDEPELDVKEDDGIFTDDDGQRWQKLDEDVELEEETIVEPTEAEAADALDGPKEKPFKIHPKVFPDSQKEKVIPKTKPK